MDIKVDRITTKNFRIQAQLMNFPTSRLLWMNTYFPTDPGGNNFDEAGLMEVLNEIEEVFDKVDLTTFMEWRL